MKSTPSGPRWTGTVRFVPEVLDRPRHWKQPRRIFVNSMSDLFNEKVQSGWIHRIFEVMAQCPQHTFLVLTKRPHHMQKWVTCHHGWAHGGFGPFLSNVWLGVSVEDQETADERIPLLLQTPAAIRWVSYEPALARVDFAPWLAPAQLDGLDWLVCGGESGPHARPFDLAWARSVIAQCRAASVPVFVKQLGSCPVYSEDPGGPFGPGLSENDPIAVMPGGRTIHRLRLSDRKGGDMSEWWFTDLMVREYPEGAD